MGMKPSEMAAAAAQVISERGHCKRTLFDDKDRRCAVGALLLVREQENWGLGTGNIVRRVLDAAEGILSSDGWQDGIIAYNNDPATSGEDIILLFKKASASLEMQGN
jgi:hypothetical protein